jgi:hypothetical protein
MEINAQTATHSRRVSDCPYSATGETQARHANHPAVRVAKPIVPKSPKALPRFQITGRAARTATPSGSIAGPHDHDRVCGPIRTARTNERTRKMDVIGGMCFVGKRKKEEPIQ